MEWRVMGKLHRIGAPAVIGYDDDGRVILEEWWNDGRLHRDGAPACIEYAAGIPIVMEWWRNDLRHNDHGAGIVSYECGRIMRQWWLNGVRVERFRVTSREWIGVVRQLLPQPIAEEIEYVLL
jgi:hypothetical protein